MNCVPAEAVAACIIAKLFLKVYKINNDLHSIAVGQRVFLYFSMGGALAGLPGATSWTCSFEL